MKKALQHCQLTVVSCFWATLDLQELDDNSQPQLSYKSEYKFFIGYKNLAIFRDQFYFKMENLC